MYEIRECLIGELPRVPSMNGLRDATEEDLMNLGLFPIGDNLFACVGVFADGRGQYKPGDQLPGRCHSSGYLEQRIGALSPEVRSRALRARVYRHTDPRQSLRHLVNDNTDPERLRAGVPALRGSSEPVSRPKAIASLEAAKARAVVNPDAGAAAEVVQLLVPMVDVQDGDVVEENLIVPARFAGEPDR